MLLHSLRLSEIGSPHSPAFLNASSWVENGRSSPSIWYNVHSSPRLATMLLSISLRDPDAALRGLANGCSSSRSRSSFSLSNAAHGIYTSPLISNSSGHPLPLSCCGMLPICLAFSVTSSPTVPSPLVSALKSFPFLYVRHIAVPSNFSSQLYVNVLPIPFAARSANAWTSAMSYVLPSDSIGKR